MKVIGSSAGHERIYIDDESYQFIENDSNVKIFKRMVKNIVFFNIKSDKYPAIQTLNRYLFDRKCENKSIKKFHIRRIKTGILTYEGGYPVYDYRLSNFTNVKYKQLSIAVPKDITIEDLEEEILKSVTSAIINISTHKVPYHRIMEILVNREKTKTELKQKEHLIDCAMNDIVKSQYDISEYKKEIAELENQLL